MNDKITKLTDELRQECVKQKITSVMCLVDPKELDNIIFLQGHATELLISLTATIHSLVEQSKGTLTLDEAMELLGEMVDMVKDHTYHQINNQEE